MKIKSILMPTVILFLVCAITTAALSLTNGLTKATIEQAKQQALEQSMNQLLPNSTFAPVNAEQTIYAAQQKGATHYIILTTAKGYKSDVEIITALTSQGEVLGVAVTDCSNESPGIGQKVGTDSAFLSQFTGRTKSSDRVDAITGATISSKAVNQGVNQAIEQFYAARKGGLIHE